MTWLAHVQQRIPPGWETEERVDSCIISVGRPGVGWVTMDFARRGWHRGSGGQSVPDPRYRGHGWSQRLVEDAIDSLRRAA